MSVNDERVVSERERWRKRWTGRSRVTTALVALLALDAFSAVMKIGRAYRLAVATGLSLEQGCDLLWMKNSARIGRTFTGSQFAFFDYSVSAFVYLCSVLLLGLAIGLHRRAIRREAAVWNYISELEKQVRNHP